MPIVGTATAPHRKEQTFWRISGESTAYAQTWREYQAAVVEILRADPVFPDHVELKSATICGAPSPLAQSGHSELGADGRDSAARRYRTATAPALILNTPNQHLSPNYRTVRVSRHF